MQKILKRILRKKEPQKTQEDFDIAKLLLSEKQELIIQYLQR